MELSFFKMKSFYLFNLELLWRIHNKKLRESVTEKKKTNITALSKAVAIVNRIDSSYFFHGTFPKLYNLI